ncbi:MAG: pSer/pThr/pTyr-binding forkhead associated (FHA) protein [Pseudoalteromonas rhizosphaerae]|jgi:pSer/pThr/pTyr-binding forkhead associated (FHA) protein|uniref:FHA domain-containing protein n=1 Tax=Pseudoalteromonas neustonica TaxID=1840331 RepID=A0ABY3FCG1_9GAMM|nr:MULTISPECIES: FHA domain-containing protein [Pseudoalteromonas]MBB1300904.1 FHA domain-containing protein [Pseudoalteromonas sp. SR44-8]MBB1398258.1 FHA domain-containing protein [Pseudoalteromonas sp. SG44-8]MBB1505698.1 FHA domain-containing protein [Pseudoalteromonas sp. SG41-1]TVU82639.1 FHA domain-containing protein [Pseudoalteromonas neustonica]
MAYLINKHTSEYCFLYAHHSFGRFQYSVDTLVNDLSVSKIHTIIEWLNGKWYIRDLSLNGTWLNHKRLVKDDSEELSIGDKIYFAGNSEVTYVVKDLSPPTDQLIKLDDEQSKTAETIKLNHYHLLPEQQPDSVVVFEQSSGQWLLESLHDDEFTIREVLEDHSIITLGGEQWMFLSSHLEVATQMSSVPQLYISDLDFIFNLSLDEETSELKVQHHNNNKDFDLHVRCHHYLTLNLARYRALDAKKGVLPANQGWVNTEQLVKDLGVDMRYLNIQIHRARKQFSEVLVNVHDAENIIERQLRKVRFAGASFMIYKGCELESTSDVVRA